MRSLDDNHALSRPHVSTQMAGPSDVECSLHTPSSPQPMQKDLVFAQTLLWLLSNQSNQPATGTLPCMSHQARKLVLANIFCSKFVLGFLRILNFLCDFI